MERLPAATRIGNNEIYMMYAGGPLFALINARLKVDVANYNTTDYNIEDFWVEKYNEPLTITEEMAQGYSKRKVCEINIVQADTVKTYLAVKVDFGL